MFSPEVCMIEVEQDLIEGARLAITTQICISVWSSQPKDKQALLVRDQELKKNPSNILISL